MSRPLLIGEIAEKDGMICLRSQHNCWFPLSGNSGMAEIFQRDFGEPQRSDIGKRLYMSGDVLQMENNEQRDARLAQGETK